MKMFIWFAKDEGKGTALKIYAVAETIELARAQVMRVLPAALHATFEKTEPQSVWSLPFAEVNMSNRGNTTALVAAAPLGGSMRVH